MNRKETTARTILVFSVVLVLHAVVKGQNIDPNAQTGIGLSPEFVAEHVADLAITPRGSKWATFRADSRISPIDIFTQHRKDFLLSAEDELELLRTEDDDLGYTHYRYQQTYKGIKIEGAETLVHARGGYAVRSNGNLVTGLDLNINPIISEGTALETALSAVNAGVYRWENEALKARVENLEE